MGKEKKTLRCKDCGYIFACEKCSKLYDQLDQELKNGNEK